MMKHYVRLACFGGRRPVRFRRREAAHQQDAKKAYTHITAAGLRMKDTVMETVTSVQENAADHSGLCQGYQRDPGRQGDRGPGRGPGGLKYRGREPESGSLFP